MGWLIRIAGWCFWLLAACVVFQAVYVLMAFGLAQVTDPPVCTVGYAFPIPFASCPGLRLGLQVDYALAIPGAVIALPFVVPQMLAGGGRDIQAMVLLPAAIHALAAFHIVFRLWRRARGGRSGSRGR